MVAETCRAFGDLDILVNNAGIIHGADFLELAEADFDRVLRVNLKGAFLVGQAAARRMVAQVKAGKRAGTIINMSSINAVVAIANHAPYCVSKGGIDQLTKVMALALAPYGIRVNAIGPGSIMTDILKAVATDKEAKRRILARTPLGRIGEPDEIAVDCRLPRFGRRQAISPGRPSTPTAAGSRSTTPCRWRTRRSSESSCPGCGAARSSADKFTNRASSIALRSGAPLIRDRHGSERSRVCSAPLRAALRPGHETEEKTSMAAKRPPALDRIDVKILAALQRDGRSTIQKLAQTVGLSPRAWLERVRRLEASGVIAGYQAVVELGRLSRPVNVFAEIILERQANSGRFEKRLAAIDDVVECWEVSGTVDYMARFVCARSRGLRGAHQRADRR